MIRFLEQTVGQDRNQKNAFLYGVCCFLSVFFLVIGAMCASSILSVDDGGGIAISWIWVVLLLVCLGLAAMAFFGKDYLRVEYDYCVTESIVDVSRVLNNKRRKNLAEFDLGKVTSCGSVSSASFARASAMPGQTKNNWFIHNDAKLYFFCYESKGQRNITVLELNDSMLQLIKTCPSLQRDAWHEEGKD